MKAVVVHGPGDLRVDEVPDPVLSDGEVLIAMEWGGLCGSDISYWRNGASGTAALKRPMVLGHEMAGRIAALAPDVTEYTVGQPVTVHPATLAGGYFGSAAFDPHTEGGFSELRAVRSHQIRALPVGVSTQQGALAEPLGVAMHAVNRAGDLRGADVLVNGAGPIGSLVVAAAKFAGAASVTAADVADAPLAVARAMGADHTVNLAAGQSFPAEFSLSFEASGAAAALDAVLKATARGGRVVQVGNLPGTPVPAVLGNLVTREITWIGSYRFVDEITDAVRAMADGLDVSPVITHRFPIDAAAEAIAVAGDRNSSSSKVLLQLSG